MEARQITGANEGSNLTPTRDRSGRIKLIPLTVRLGAEAGELRLGKRTRSHDLGAEVVGVEVRHKVADLAALDLEDAHALVGDGISVRGTFVRPRYCKSAPIGDA